MRIEIAKQQGFLDIYRCSKSLKRNNMGMAYGKTYAGTLDPVSTNYPRVYKEIPDYEYDIAAVRQVVETLNQDKREEFIQNLCVILVNDKYENAWWDLTPTETLAVWRATPKQCCEALIKII